MDETSPSHKNLVKLSEIQETISIGSYDQDDPQITEPAFKSEHQKSIDSANFSYNASMKLSEKNIVNNINQSAISNDKNQLDIQGNQDTVSNSIDSVSLSDIKTLTDPGLKIAGPEILQTNPISYHKDLNPKRCSLCLIL